MLFHIFQINHHDKYALLRPAWMIGRSHWVRHMRTRSIVNVFNYQLSWHSSKLTLSVIIAVLFVQQYLLHVFPQSFFPFFSFLLLKCKKKSKPSHSELNHASLFAWEFWKNMKIPHYALNLILMCENTASAYAVTPAGQIQTWDGHSEGNQTCYGSCVAFLDFKSDNLRREKRQWQSSHKWG